MRRFNFYLMLIAMTLFVGCKDDDPAVPSVKSELSYDALFSELNFARTSPAEYAKLIEEMLPYYNGNYLHYSDEIIYTNEGKAAAEEAIAALKSQPPVSPLSINVGLNKASQYHCDKQGITGQTGHNSPDGKKPGDRMLIYGTFGTAYSFGENIIYGPKTARKVIIGLIIDDGVKDRGHRINIYEPSWTDVGFGWGYHKNYEIMCVMGFASGYTANSSRVVF